jgi:glutathione S-transferase
MAKVDIYLDWHHAGVRMGAEGYLYRKLLAPMMSGKPVPAEALEQSWAILMRSLSQVVRIWLPKTGSKKFMFGNKPSIADLALACEVANLKSINFPLAEKFPSIHKWLYVDMMSLEGFKEVHHKGMAKLDEMDDMRKQMLKKENEAKM